MSASSITLKVKTVCLVLFLLKTSFQFLSESSWVVFVFISVMTSFCLICPHLVFTRVYPYLCRAVRNFVTDHSQTPGLPAKEYYVSFTDVSRRLKYDRLIQQLTKCETSKLVSHCWGSSHRNVVP